MSATNRLAPRRPTRKKQIGVFLPGPKKAALEDKLDAYLATPGPHSLLGWKQFCGEIPDETTRAIHAELEAAGLLQKDEQPGGGADSTAAASRSSESILEIVSRSPSAQAVIRKLQPTARKRTRKT